MSTAFSNEALQRFRSIVESGTPLARNTQLRLVEAVGMAGELLDRVAKVRELHKNGCYREHGRYYYRTCPTCKVPYPCMTVAALGGTP